jgi:hypothetical protein
LFTHVEISGHLHHDFTVFIQNCDVVAVKLRHRHLDSDPLVEGDEKLGRLWLEIIPFGEEVESCLVWSGEIQHKHTVEEHEVAVGNGSIWSLTVASVSINIQSQGHGVLESTLLHLVPVNLLKNLNVRLLVAWRSQLGEMDKISCQEGARTNINRQKLRRKDSKDWHVKVPILLCKATSYLQIHPKRFSPFSQCNFPSAELLIVVFKPIIT